MTDRELLEFAAKAAGIEFDPERSKPNPNSGVFFGLWLVINGEPYEGQRRRWNPLTDDGDEARLEAVMGFNVEWRLQQVRVSSRLGGAIESYADHGGDKQRARRRAGVRAAAAIGKKMP